MTRRLTREEIENLALERNHELLCENFEQEYKNVHSPMRFRCLTCDTEFVTTVHSYKNAKRTGCPTCKKEAISKAQTGKIVSEETRKLIGEKASERPGSLLNVKGAAHPSYKGGYGRDFKKPSTLDYDWLQGVKKRCKYSCVITNSKTDLVCHHLEGWNINPELRYVITNGICIRKDLHKEFHDLYKYGNNTEQQFAEYCQTKHNIDWYERKKELGQSSAELSSE